MRPNQNITFIYAGNINSVRIQKMANFFSRKGVVLNFVGWNRDRKNVLTDPKFSNIKYILNGGGEGTKILPLLYIVFIVKLCFYVLFNKRNFKSNIIIAINFECAYVMYLINKITGIRYIYDIWDEMAISHKFPKYVKKFIRRLDQSVRKSAFRYIHVDPNRLSEIDSNNFVIIYNSPFDFISTGDCPCYENRFAVTGWLNNTRGLKSIFEFAKSNSEIKFTIIGEFIDDKMKTNFLGLKNVEYHHFMPQEKLFNLIKNCRGIFSLYDPSIEINRLAASNKLYDAMMLSIPVVVNKGLVAASMVEENHIGYVVNYDYDESWGQLKDFNPKELTAMGRNGRKIYLEKYEFGNMMDNIFMPITELILK